VAQAIDEKCRRTTALTSRPVRPRTAARGKALGLMGRWVAGDPAVSERRALPARSPDRHLMLTRMGARRIHLSTPRAAFEHKSTVCGLNGLRPHASRGSPI